MNRATDEYRHHKLNEEQNALIDECQRTLPDKPVDVYKLAEQFGCSCVDYPLDWRVSGAIRREGQNTYRIYVNANDPEPRRRFTCAHELAHFLLHREHLDDDHVENIMFRSNLSNAQETEANKLAADILMPRDKLDALAETRKYGFNELAKMFNVSRQALLVRLGIPEYHALK